MDEVRGHEALIKRIQEIHKDFPDAAYRIDDMVAEDDRVVTRWTVSGTHRHTRKKVELSGMSMVRIEDGKIAESWIERDSLVLVMALAPSDFVRSLLGWSKRLRG
jgi:predicted ester cyclase